MILCIAIRYSTSSWQLVFPTFLAPSPFPCTCILHLTITRRFMMHGMGSDFACYKCCRLTFEIVLRASCPFSLLHLCRIFCTVFVEAHELLEQKSFLLFLRTNLFLSRVHNTVSRLRLVRYDHLPVKENWHCQEVCYVPSKGRPAKMCLICGRSSIKGFPPYCRGTLSLKAERPDMLP